MNETELKKLEDRLWSAADKMRGAVSVSDYKFIVLGLIFLKYISDSFEERYKELVEEGYGLEEEKDSYTEKNIFYVPKNARWSYLEEHSKDDNIGEIIAQSVFNYIQQEENIERINKLKELNVNMNYLVKKVEINSNFSGFIPTNNPARRCPNSCTNANNINIEYISICFVK